MVKKLGGHARTAVNAELGVNMYKEYNILEPKTSYPICFRTISRTDKCRTPDLLSINQAASVAGHRAFTKWRHTSATNRPEAQGATQGKMLEAL